MRGMLASTVYFVGMVLVAAMDTLFMRKYAAFSANAAPVAAFAVRSSRLVV